MIQLPSEVRALLDASVRRVRKIYLLRGIAATLAATLAVALIVMGVDAWFTIFSDAARWALSAGLYVVVALVAILTLVRPLVRRLDDRRMAKILDARHEENEECLSTLVEILEDSAKKGARPNCSEALLALLTAKTTEAARRIDPEREFTPRTIVRRIRWLVAVSVLLVASFVLVPHLAGRLFIRAVAPWADVGNLYSNDITVRPGDVKVLNGTVVRIEATVDPSLHCEPQIRISRKTDLGWGEEFAEEMNAGVYEVTATLDEREWRYRISAGPAVSRYYTVKVCEYPKYREFLAQVVYPEYTGLGMTVHSNDEVMTIQALAGSKVMFALDVKKGVKADFRVNGREAFSHTMVSNRTASWTLDLESAEGFKAPRRGGLLKSFLDMPPTIVVESPQEKSLKLPPHAKFPFEITASDDVSLGEPELRMRREGEDWEVWRKIEGFSKTGASLWRAKDEIDLSTLGLENVRAV